MTRTALILVLAAACGGHKPGAAQPAHDVPTAQAAPAPAVAATPEAPAAATPGDDLLAQAALTEQYELGRKLYVDKKCASCHEASGVGNAKNPAVIGETALPEQPARASRLRKGITFETAKDVMDFVKAKMPIKAPGTLTDDEAAAVTAWMLSESKVAIDRKLDATNAATVMLRAR